MSKLSFYHFLRFVLLIVSCGFYTLPVAAFENPAHPRSPEEIAEDQRKEDDKYTAPHPADEYDDAPQNDKRNWANKE